MAKAKGKAKRKGAPRAGGGGEGSAAARETSAALPWGWLSVAAGAIALVAAWLVWQPSYAHSVVPEALGVEVVRAFPHDPAAWTQGLVWHGGELYEGTGLEGKSTVRRVDLASGRVLEQVSLPRDVFGEGLAAVGDRLVQISWKEGRAFVWDRKTLKKLREFSYDGEGWGLCFDGKRLVMSDGSERLAFRDPDTFKETGFVYVHEAGHRFAGRLNELECAEGVVYANVWTAAEDRIVKIDPATGNVVANIDAAGLLTATETRGIDVLNGIAFVPERGTFLITGKFWPRMFEVRFRPKGEKGAAKSRAAK